VPTHHDCINRGVVYRRPELYHNIHPRTGKIIMDLGGGLHAGMCFNGL